MVISKSIAKPFKASVDFTLQLCNQINTPRSLTVKILIENQEWDQLINLSIDPNHYDSHLDFKDDYLITEVLRKSPYLPSSYDTAGEALKTFLLAEQMCKSASQRIFTSSANVFNEVGRLIQRTIGPLTRRDLDSVVDRAGNGAGATVCMRGSGTVLSDKFRIKHPSVTHELIPFARSIMGSRWADSVRSFDVVEGNVFFTVPKTAKTDRGCAKEPLLNMFLQKGIGSVLRSKLAVAGCNLNDQSVNQDMARRAQRDGLATIDLSMASDLISSALVYRLLPPRWFELLDLARSKKTTLPDGSVVDVEKFSSMGNGFTFELESLIFLSIARTIVPRSRWNDVNVYGDDIIVPAEHASQVVELLETFGLVVNRSKTFLAGRFYESCGSDYFDGKNVRPFYLKELPKGIVPQLPIANKLRQYSIIDGGCDARWRPLWLTLFQSAPKSLRTCKVPLKYGDLGFIVSRNEIKAPRVTSLEDVYRLKHLVVQPIKRDHQDIYVLWSSLGTGIHTDDILKKDSSVFSKGREPVRGYLRKPRMTTSEVYFPGGLDWV